MASPGARADYDSGYLAYDAGDYPTAMHEWNAVAEIGDADAQYGVGLLYDEGYGVPEDDAEAAYWYRRAAEQGHLEAQFWLAYMYDEGLGVARDDAEAAFWYRLAADQGDAVSLFNLALLYVFGEGVAQSDISAYAFFWLADRLGDPESRGWLQELDASLLTEDIAEALRFAMRTDAASYALFGEMLGDSFAEGGAGDASSLQFESGYEAYERGDYVAAFRAWLSLAEQGDVYAQYDIAYMYDYGEGVEENDAKAVYWYTKAAEQGDAEAQFSLGYMYDYGLGTPLDDAEAIYWYTRAGEQEHVTAQYYLGIMYGTGEGTPVDYAQAANWYRLAAEQDHADAQFELAHLYFEGEGVAADVDVAVDWFQESGRQGNVDALYLLGWIHADGLGIAPNPMLGYAFYSLAASLGDAEATEAARAIARDLPTVELALAEEIIAAWETDIGLEETASIAGAPGGFAESLDLVETVEAPPDEPVGSYETKERSAAGSGSGFVVTWDGFVLTNHHVIEACAEITLRPENQAALPGVLIASNADDDLALLKLAWRHDAIATFRAGAGVRPGDDIVVVGYPHHGLLSTDMKVTKGSVTAARGMENDPNMYQMTAPTQPGNSGGPMLDLGGNVTGIVEMSLVSTRAEDVPQNVNFAIKSDVALAFLDQNGVAYQTAGTTVLMSAADVADAARGYTLLIECWN